MAPTMSDNSILWFEQIGKGDISTAGGKGANLGELTRAGIPVPAGFVVSADAYRAFVEAAGLRPKIAGLLSSVDPRNVQGLQIISREVQSLIENIEVPSGLALAIEAAYERLGSGPVAVRSSATAEDLPQASFAGQQTTFLNVTGAGRVVEAVRACWASLFEAHAVSYRQQRGFDHLEVAIAVPVQKMVQSERSGIMFTVNPVTGAADQIVIEAVWGLGEAAVSGMVTPDMYIVDKASLAVVESAPSEQDQELVRDESAAGIHATAWRDVPPERRTETKLLEEEAAALARLGLQVERLYGHPQDIEWAIEGREMYLLQTRPVTTV